MNRSFDCCVNELDLLINIDGRPLYKSSPSPAIPILVSVVNVTEQTKIIFLIMPYYGFQKPKDLDEFLTLFVLGTIELSESGFLTANGINMFRGFQTLWAVQVYR